MRRNPKKTNNRSAIAKTSDAEFTESLQPGKVLLSMPLFAYFYNMKYAIAIIGSLCVFASCQYFSTEKISSESIYEEELKSINWTDVDTFPAFPGCDDLIAQEAQKNCFQKTITQSLEHQLSQQQVVAHQSIWDTVWLKMEVDPNGRIGLLDLAMDSLTLVKIPEIQRIFQESLEALPKPAPAYKRGVPVRAQFTLPVVIRSEKITN